MRILWIANTVWCHTGYGTQTRYVLPKLASMGHDVYSFAMYGLEGGALTIGIDGAPIKVLPHGNDAFGCDILAYYVQHHQIDLVMSLHDLWPLPRDYHKYIPCKWAVWFPVDHQPVPQLVLERAQAADYPVVYSRFAEAECAAAHLETTYIPHGINTTLFSPGDKAEGRASLDIPADAYLAVAVATNKGYPARKSFWEILRAFKLFREAHPERESFLYLHCDYSTSERGMDLPAMGKHLGLSRNLKFVRREPYNEGLPEEYVVKVYRTADVLLNPAMGEGFGLPIAEAQACGCPVITTDCTSMSELTVNGIATPPLDTWWTPLNAYQYVADYKAVYGAMETLYARSPEEQAAEAAKGRAHIVQEYDWANVMPRYFAPFLERVEADIRDNVGAQMLTFGGQ